MNNILENSNKQVVINKLFNDRINNITLIANEILKNAIVGNEFNNQSASRIQYKLKLIKEEVVNINYAVHWAKVGVINSILLSI